MGTATDQPHATLLIVDDTPENIRVLGEELRDDYRMLVATSGDRALEIARGPEPPDLILLDIMMPRMDGREVCRRLQADPHTADIPVLFVTALAKEADEAEGLALGAVDYITKPVSLPIARARIRTHLALRDARQKVQDAYDELAREMRTVAHLQEGLLPDEPLHQAGLHVDHAFHPSWPASGDYCDYFAIPGGVRVVVADVSGHGARSAFIGAMVRTMVHCLSDAAQSLDALAGVINTQLLDTVEAGGDFASLLLVDVLPEQGVVQWVNAGHPPGFLVDGSGQLTLLESSTFMAGLYPATFAVQQAELPDSFRLALFTDGYYEWFVHGEEQYGFDRFATLLQAWLQRADVQPPDLANSVVADAAADRRGVADRTEPPFDDDLTLVVVSREDR